MKKVVSFVLNNFTNDSRVLKENLSLQKAGYEVQIVALHEKPLEEHEHVQGIPTHRIKLRSRNWSKNKLVQILKYFEFIYRVVKKYKRSDILHCNDLNTLPIGYIIKRFYNKDVKIVYDAHEYETEVNGLKGFKKIVVKNLERFLIRHADSVLCVSDTIANEYVKLYNIKKPSLVLNAPSYRNSEKKNIFRETLGIKKNEKIFLYQGALSEGRGIEILLETFKKINSAESVIVFMGYGSLAKSVQEASAKYENIYFHKAVSPEVLLSYTSSADFGISTIEDICLSYRYCLPNKIFEYIMSGLPVIVSNLDEMKKLVHDNNIGIVAEENTVSGLKEAVLNALLLDRTNLYKNLDSLSKVYNWEEQEKVLLNEYKELF